MRVASALRRVSFSAQGRLLLRAFQAHSNLGLDPRMLQSPGAAHTRECCREIPATTLPAPAVSFYVAPRSCCLKALGLILLREHQTPGARTRVPRVPYPFIPGGAVVKHAQSSYLAVSAALFAASLFMLGQPAVSASDKASSGNCVQTNDIKNMSPEEFRKTYESG